MKFSDADAGISIDSEFPCGSAGSARRLDDLFYEIGYQPEAIPDWFQALLDELFEGGGVPKEYMAHVRVSNGSADAARVTLRFLLSEKGSGYMYPPWWVWRQDAGWIWVPTPDTSLEEHRHIDVSVALSAGETVRVASAPYEDPADVVDKCRLLAERSAVWSYREMGTTAQGRPIPLPKPSPEISNCSSMPACSRRSPCPGASSMWRTA